jgi:hypothetical protein
MSARPRSAAATWKALEDAAWSAELRRIRGLSEDDLDRELAHVGIEPNAARAICQELVEGAARAAGIEPATVKTDALRPPTGAYRRPLPRSRGPLLFVGAAALSAVVVMVAAWSFGACGGGAADDRPHVDGPRR